MISFEAERNPPWFFQYIENYSHLLLDLRFKTEDTTVEMVNFSFDLEIQGFEGLIFYIYFKEDHKFIPVIRSGNVVSNFQTFTWTPSLLFKNIKSVIKISNKYEEIIPREYFDRYYYQFDSSFKGNKTEFLFSLINLLVHLEEIPEVEPLVTKIKMVISKTNELLFELIERSIPLEMINLLKEIERLKFNLGNLSKEEIFNWLDDLLTSYSEKI